MWWRKKRETGGRGGERSGYVKDQTEEEKKVEKTVMVSS